MRLIIFFSLLSIVCSGQSITGYGAQKDSLNNFYIVKTIQTKTNEGVQVTQEVTKPLTKEAALKAVLELDAQLKEQAAQVGQILKSLIEGK